MPVPSLAIRGQLAFLDFLHPSGAEIEAAVGFYFPPQTLFNSHKDV